MSRHGRGTGRCRRVHVLFESQDAATPNGSSYIRLLRPLSHPSNQGTVVVSHGAEMTDDDVDLVIIDRLWHGDLAPGRQSSLLATLQRRSIPYVYSIDDNLLDLNLQPGRRQYPTAVQRNLVREFIRSAAGVIVSTSHLAQRLAPLNRKILVLPNQLDETLYSRVGKRGAGSPGGELVIGYMGTFSHLDDLMMIAQPLRKVLASHPRQVRLELVGVAQADELRAMFSGFDVRVLEVPGRAVPYPEFVGWMQQSMQWDFALAPLERNHFNRSKSDIKLLDYGILGIPGIFSRAPAYEETVVHDRIGLLVENSNAAWEASLERLVADPDLRASLAAAVKEYVWSSRTLAQHAAAWPAALDEILASRPSDSAGTWPPHWSVPRAAEADGPEAGRAYAGPAGAGPAGAPAAAPRTREERLLFHIDKAGLGLEIGPSFSPVVPKAAGFRVEILDHATREALVAKYAGSGVDTSRIEAVDYVWQGEPMDELTGKSDHYDYVIASHVVEHTPDLVAFLNQIGKMLKPGGILSLAVPDCRYCFDVFRGVTTAGDVLQAHVEHRKRHSVGTVFDHFASIAMRDGKPSWNPGATGKLAFLHGLEDAWKMVEQSRATDEYMDVHNWRFTPSSFRLILNDLNALGLVSLSEKGIFTHEGSEFYVSLEKRPERRPLSVPERLRLAVAAREELASW